MLTRLQDVTSKLLILPIMVGLLASCEQKNEIHIDYSTAVFGLVKPLAGSSGMSASSTCPTAVARLYEIDVNGALSPVLATSPLDADGTYKLSGLNGRSMGITQTGIDKSYVINVDGCGKIYSRFVTRSPNQDVSFGSSLVSYIVTSTFSKEAYAAYANGKSRELEQLIAILDSAESHEAAFTKLQSDATAKSLFVGLFKMDPADLAQAIPLVAPIDFPNEFLETENHPLKVTAFHWDPQYGMAVMWRKNGEYLGGTTEYNYVPSADSQADNVPFTVFVGRALPDGRVDLSKPHYSKSFVGKIANNKPPVVPAVTLASAATTRQPTIYLQLQTGASASECATFKYIAINENSMTAPSQEQFQAQNTTCTHTPTQLVSYTLANPADGTKLLRVWTMDSAGNISQMPRTATVVIDQNAPILGFLTPAASSSFNSSFTITGTCESGYSVNIGGTGVSAPKTTACSGGNFSDTVTLSNIDGIKEVRLTQTDLAGNLSQSSRNFIRDTIAPIVSFTTPAANARFQNSLTVTGACEAGLPVRLSGAGIAANVNTTCTAGAFSASILLSAGEGTKAISISQTDAAGNVGTATRSFVRDNTPPSLAITSPAAGTPAQASLIVSGSCESGLDVQLGGAGITAETTSCTAGAFSETVSFTAGEGNKVVTITQTDEAGNSASDSRTFIRDNTAPTLVITSPASGTEAQTGVTLQGTCEPGWSVVLGGAGHASPASAVCGVGGSFSVAVDFTAGEGSKVISVTQTDGAGNIGTDSRTFERDNTAPVMAFTSPAAGTSAQSGLTINGTCESPYQVSIGGSGVSAPSTALCIMDVFTASITFSAVDGTKTVELSQTDAAGNTGTASRDFERDNEPPVLTFTSPAANTPAQTGLTINGTCEAGLTVTLAGTGITSVTTTCPAGTFSRAVSFTAGEGTKTVSISQTDAAGNTGTESRDFIRDNTPPVLTFTSPAANTTAQTEIDITGTCEAGLTVNLGGTGITADTTTCTGGTFSSTVIFTAGEGTKTVEVSQTDAAGNVGTETRDFVRDNTPPALTFTSPAANTPAQTGLTITGTCEAGLTVTLNGDGITSTTATCAAGTFSQAVSFTAGEGNKVVDISQTDAAGNTGTASRTFVRDNTPPAIAFTSPAANTTAQTGLTITGTCEAGLTVTLNGAGITSTTATCAAGTFSQAVSFTAGEGNKVVDISQTDAAGNTGTASRTFVRDNTPPAIAFTSPAANTTAQTGLTITGTCEAGLTVTLNGTGITSTTATCAAGTFSQAVSFTAGEGNKVVDISQTDAAGNTGTASRTFVRDNTPPAIAFTSPAANTTAQTGLTITGTCEAGLTVTLNGAGITSTTATCAAGTFSQAVSFTAGEGNKVVDISQTDAAGNTGTASRTFIRDNTPPALAFTSPAANTTAQTGLTITGTCEAGLTVTLNGTGITSTTATCAAGTFSQAVSFTAGEGNKVVDISQTDAAGNTGTASRTFVRDNTPPALAFTSPAANTTAQTGLTITGTCETGLTVTLNGTGITSTTTTCTSGTFSRAVTFTAGEGNKVVDISQTDAAGNTGTASRTFIRDNTPPALAFTSPAANTTAQTGLTITGTCETGLTVTLNGTGITSTTATCAAGTFSSAVSFTAGEGNKVVDISQTDAAGNTGTASRTFIRDNTPPALAFTSPAANTTAQTGLTITGTCETGLTVTLNGAGITATTAACTAGAFSQAVSFTAGEGNKVVSISQTDAAGNTGTASRTFIRDNTPPALAFTSPAANTTAQTGLTITGTCETGLTVTLAGAGITSTTTTCTAGAFSRAVTFTAGEGTKTVSISQTDAAGNIGTETRDFIRDNTAPALAFTSPAANTTAQTGLTITGTCETGLTVTLNGAGITSTTTTCAAGTFSRAVTFTAGEGTKTVNISQTDAAGNIGTETRDFVRDNTPPALAFSTPAANTSAQTGLTITGTCETGLTVTLNGTGITATTATCTAGAFSQAVTFSAGEGTKTVNISQTDAAGNTGSATRDFVRDNTAPSIAFTSPAANTNAQTGLTITGTCETGLTVTLNGTGITATTATCTAGAFSQAVTFSAGEGTKTVNISQTDAAGNTGSATRDFVRDNTAPSIAFTSPAANTTAQTGLTITGTCETGLTVTLNGAGITSTTTPCSGGTFSRAVTFTAGEGNKVVDISQTDAAGNVGTASRTFVRDNTEPNIAISTPTANTPAQTGVTVTGTCETGLTVTLNGTGITSTTTTCTAGAFSRAVTFTAGEGTKTVNVSQTDAAGNVGTDTRDFIRDNTAPALTFTSPAANTNAATGLTITGTCETGLTVTLNGTGITSTTTTCTGGTFSRAVTFTAGEGTKTVNISQTDAAGNTGSATRDFIRDSVAPSIAITAPAANTRAQTGVTVSGTCETGLTVTLNGTGITSTTTTCTAGAFSRAVTFTAGEGTKTVNVSQTDAAGNVGTDTRDFIRDNTPPALAFTSPAANTVAQTGVTVVGTCEAGLTVTLAGTGITSTTTTCAAGTFSQAVTFTAGDGTKNVTISQTDAAGNTGTANRNFVRDSTPPAIAFTSPAEDTSAQTGLTITGTCETGLTVTLNGTGITSTTTTCTAGTFSRAVTFTAGEGSKTVNISQTDAVGNVGTDTRDFVRDNTAPAIAFSSPAANTTAQTGLTITGTCETGLTVTLNGAGITSTTTTCTAGAFSRAVTFTAGEGNKVVTISQTDAAGNTGTANRTFVRDNTEPALAFSSPAANTTAQTGLTVTGTCETGLTVTLNGAGITSTTTTCTAGAFSRAVTFTAGEGNKVVNISQTDAAGNVGTDTRTFIRDNTAPSIAFTSPAANTPGNTGLTITGTCETGLTVTLNGTGITATTATCTGGTFSQAVTFTAGEGTKAVSISQTDAAGNTGTTSRNFVRDSTAPSLAFTSPAANTPAQTGFTIAGTCETGLTVTVNGAGVSPATSASCTGSAFSVAITFSAGEGNKVVTISQTDAAGNTGTANRTFIRDNTAPSIAFTSPAANTSAQTGLTVTGSCETGLTVSLGGAGITSTTASCTASAFSAAVTFSAGNGTKVVTISQTDVAGNVGTDTRNFVRDTVAPVLSFTSPAANTTAQTGLTIAGACETGLTVTVNGAGITATTATCTASAYSVAVTFTAGEGNKVVSVSQTDAAGNTGTASRTFIRDNTAPALAFSSPAANTVGKDGLTITGTCETGLTVTLNGTGITSTTTTCTGGTFSRAVTFTAGDGNKLVTISQTDAAGNTGSANRTFVRDATPPALTITAAANGTSAQSSLTMTGACETGLDIDFAGAGLLSAFSIACSGGTYSQTVFFSSGDGNKVITVTQTDTVTNTTTVSRTYVRDNAAPAITQSTLAYPHYSNTNTVTFGGSCEAGLTVTMKRGGTTEGTTTCTSGTWSRATTSQTTDGTRDYTFEQTDSAGNTGTANGRWIRDVVLPTLAITSSSSLLNASNSVTFSGTCEAGLPNNIQVSGADTSSTACSSGSWSYTTVTRTTDGTRTYTFSLTDQAGNTRSVSGTWERNTQYPNLAITTPTPVINQNNTATITGTCQSGLNIEIRRSGTLENTITCPSGTFSYTTTSQTTDANRPYEFRQTNAIPLTTNQTVNWIRDTTGPTFVASYFKIDNDAAYTSKARVNLAMRATDALTKVTHVCPKVDDTTAPAANDSCWVAVDSSEIGLTPATTVNITTFGFNLPLVPGGYAIYGFAKDEAGNVSALTNSGAGTALRDTDSILYDLAVPPTMHKVLIGSTDAMANPPTPANLTVSVGSPVFIKWRVTDDVALPATPITIYFTTDDTEWSVVATNLTNGANGSCQVNNAGTTADDDATGCYRWAAAPTSSYFKVRVVAKDNTGLESGLSSVGMNVSGSIRFIAGNTDPGDNLSAQAAVFFSRTTTTYGHNSAETMAVSRDGVIFVLDGEKGLVRVDPIDGIKRLILPQTGTLAGSGVPVTSATGRTLLKIALDYNQPKQRLWIWDHNTIRRLDLATDVITTVIGGSGTDNADTVSNPLNAQLTNYISDSYWRSAGVFFAMPNGDFYFQGANDINNGSVADNGFRVRWLEASSGTIKSMRLGTITHMHGLGVTDRGNCRPRNIALVRDSSSNITERILQLRTSPYYGTGCDNADSMRLSRLDANGNSIGTLANPTGTVGWTGERIRYHHGLDGKIYAFYKEGGSLNGIYIYNPEPTSTWTKIYGGTLQGRCLDTTSATACNSKIDSVFVSENGTVFILELGAIRTITPSQTVQTISGNPIVADSGTEVMSARIGMDVRNFQVRSNGAIVFTDNIMGNFYEFARGGSLFRIAGNGTVGQPTFGVDSTTTAASVHYDTHQGGYFAMDPATGDLFHHTQRMQISKMTRSTSAVGSEGIWNYWMGNGTYGYSNPSAEGSADVGFNKECDVAFDPLVHKQVSCGWYPLLMGIFNNKIYTMFTQNSDRLSDGADMYRLRATKLYDLTTQVQTTLIQGSSSNQTAANTACGIGTSLDACDFMSNRGGRLTVPDYDSVTNTYYITNFASTSIYALTPGGTLQRHVMSQGVNALAFRRNGATRYLYYCSSSTGQIRRYNINTATDTALDWPIPSMKCNYAQMQWNASTTSVIFPYTQNGLSGIAEYVDP